MPLKSPTRPRDPEKADRVRFADEPRSSADIDDAARPRVIQAARPSLLSRIVSPEAIPWILTCVFATTTILLLMERPDSMNYGSYETRFSTDFSECVRLLSSQCFFCCAEEGSGVLHHPHFSLEEKKEEEKFVDPS